MTRLTIILVLLMTMVMRAHQIAEMKMRIEAGSETFQAVVEADAAYMLPEFRGDEEVAAQDLAWLRNLGASEWARIRAETERYLRSCLSVGSGSEAVSWDLHFPDFYADPPTFVTEGIAEGLPMIAVRIDGAFKGNDLTLGWNEPFGVVLIVQSGTETVPIISGYREPVFQRGTGGEVSAVESSLLDWVRLGLLHIIPGGPDHVLFILGIFLLSPKWKPLLVQSLIFTLAHSLTLGMAVAGWVRLPERWVEAAIAASIAWIGIENLWLKNAARGRYLLIAGFGLIHGLGFARMLIPDLQDDPLHTLILGIAGFNLGVEAGQILVLAMAFALFGWWQEKQFALVRTVGSALVACAGCAMLIQRIVCG